MRISRAQADANRARVVETAAELFRARGFEGVSVGELMGAAGFTHGGFYNHFGSKEALAAEALAAAWAEMAAARAQARDVAQLLEGYLSRTARGAPGKSCPAAALACDVARGPGPVRAAFADGLETMIAEVAAGLPQPDAAARREQAVATVAAMVGALMLSRAVPDESPLADELLAATRKKALASLG